MTATVGTPEPSSRVGRSGTGSTFRTRAPVRCRRAPICTHIAYSVMKEF